MNNPCDTCHDLECKFEMRDPCRKAVAWEKLSDEFYLQTKYIQKGIGAGFGDWHDRQAEIKAGR